MTTPEIDPSHPSPDLIELLREHGFSFERLEECVGQDVEVGFETRGGGYRRGRYYPILEQGIGVVLPSLIRGTVKAASATSRYGIIRMEEGLEVQLAGWRPRTAGRHYWPASDPPGNVDYLEIRLVTRNSLELLIRVPMDRVYLGPHSALTPLSPLEK